MKNFFAYMAMSNFSSLYRKKGIDERVAFFFSHSLPVICLLCCFHCFLYAPARSWAQVNIETLRKTELKEGINSSIDAKLGFISGNASSRNLSGKARLDYYQKEYHLFFIADGQRADAQGELFKHKGFLHARGQWGVNSWLDVELFAQESFNDFLLLKERNVVGSGLRFVFAEEQASTDQEDEQKQHSYAFTLGIGFMHERERFKDWDEPGTKIIRSTNYISGKWRLTDIILLSATAYYQVNSRYFRDYRLLCDGSFGVHINKQLLLTLNFNYRYDSQPPLDLKRQDSSITNGLKYLF